MLKKLKIENFAIIDTAKISPSSGLNVFTGETGAGKSIIIEALNFVLGSRASTDSIKEGAELTKVEAEFTCENIPKFIQDKYAVNAKNISLKRQLDRKAKNKSFINGKPVSVSALAKIGDYLVDFHGQYEHQLLLKPAMQLQFLDKFGSLENNTAKIKETYKKHKDILKRLEAVKLSTAEKERLLDLYKYQLDEIENAQIKPNEDLELDNIVPKLKNAHQLVSLCQASYDALYEGEKSAVENLSKAIKNLDEISLIDPSLEHTRKSINEALTIVEDTSREISSYKDNIDVDPQKVDDIISRQDKLSTLKKKYGPSLEDVQNYAEDVKQKISDLEFSDKKISDLELQLKEAAKTLKKQCSELHEKRMSCARKLSNTLQKEIKPLGFADIKFNISVEMDEENITETGADSVDFLFSSNLGQSLKPLKNIISGGELSRVMLGLKTVLSDNKIVSVFDEIDAGIGGTVGKLVGEKLKKHSKNGQIFCITHLAQIAGYADTHYMVNKKAEKTKVLVEVENLNKDNRILEVSRMLAGRKTSKTSIKHAEEILKEIL